MAYKRYLLICGGQETSCKTQRENLLAAFHRELYAKNLNDEVQVVQTGCFGLCEEGPVVKVLPEGTLYTGIEGKDVAKIVEQHLVGGEPVSELSSEGGGGEQESYHKQTRIVLRNCGVIDPNSIEEYIAREGYQALSKAINQLSPEEIIEELNTAGLRGRGGAGFPTWRKWEFTRATPEGQKYVVCNADEGDPGAYMDRSTMEGDPHSVLEAMAIAGRTVGADQGYVYIRAEYPLAIERLNNAIEQAKEYGLLGKNIMGSNFSFDIELRLGAGAFVCGEETALLASMVGERGMPVPRPPFPAVKGLWERPTVINNVETLANIPMIINRGGEWFSQIGTPNASGTKVFALTGKIRNSGLIEVPMGTTLREIIYDIGGGIPGGEKFKAVQTGGPSGGMIPEEHLDTPIGYGELQKLGSIMGSGGMIVMGENDCIVDVAKFYLEFAVEESCGKCAPCRVGGRTLYNLLKDVSKGKATEGDLAKMRSISHAMQKASLCGLGQTTPNPVLAALRYFGDEFQAHISDKTCPAGICRDLITYKIDPEKCIGCTLCARKCPANCISGEKQQPHKIDQSECIKCGECYEACKFDAITRN